MPTFVSAHSPVMIDSTHINLMVKFVEFANELPFTASSTDSEEYGRNIYEQAAAGVFGTITSQTT